MSLGTCLHCERKWERRAHDHKSKFCPSPACQKASSSRQGEYTRHYKAKLSRRAKEGKAKGWKKCQGAELMQASQPHRECKIYLKPGGNRFFCEYCHSYVTVNRVSGSMG